MAAVVPHGAPNFVREEVPASASAWRWLLLAGLSSVAVMDSINSTVLSIARAQMMGSSHATPDEIAWLNIAYFIAKLTMFPVAVWIVMRAGFRRALLGATSLLLVSALACGMTTDLGQLIAWRIAQGAGGAVLLVAAQTLLFEIFPARQQGVVQAVFALAIIMMPVAIAPALQGWTTDTLSWSWIFLLSLPFGAIGLLSLLLPVDERPRRAGRLDWPGAILLGIAMACLVFVLQEGSRYDWFEEPKIVSLSIGGVVALALFVAWEVRVQKCCALIDFGVFRDQHFTFGFIVSFIAGCALFGSAFIIPAFALLVIDLGPTHAGLLQLPSSAVLGLGLLTVGGLIQFGKVPPINFIPFGILCFMTAMWMLSDLTVESGVPDMTSPLLLRGLGLCLLFIPLTISTLSDLGEKLIAHGVALFNFGRQMGGLVGISCLSTYLDHQASLNRSVLASYLGSGNAALAERHDTVAALLVARGYNPAEAPSAAMAVIEKTIQAQVDVLSFSEAFLALALLFVVAVPILVSIKLAQSLFGGHGGH
jgi:MFS transporter, DHA2 family, multidrug resistance protein